MAAVFEFRWTCGPSWILEDTPPIRFGTVGPRGSNPGPPTIFELECTIATVAMDSADVICRSRLVEKCAATNRHDTCRSSDHLTPLPDRHGQ